MSCRLVQWLMDMIDHSDIKKMVGDTSNKKLQGKVKTATQS